MKHQEQSGNIIKNK